jgi:hypothetical protein
MQDVMANGNYAPFLAQALTPPFLGAAGTTMGGYGGFQGTGPQFGGLGLGSPGLGNAGLGIGGQQGFGQQFGQPQQMTAQQQQQIAATLHQLAHHVAAHSAIGQQVGATLQQLAQYCIQGVVAGQQFAQLLNQLAQQCAWQAHAARVGGLGMQSIYGQPFGGQPFGIGVANPTPFGQSGLPAWGFNRPAW